MQKRELIFDGNEKQVFATDDPNKVIFHYKDVTLAYNGIKRAVFVGKGILTNNISAILLGKLGEHGIPTHFIETLGDREQLCRKIEIIPLIVAVRNRISGSLASLLGVKEGTEIPNTIYELQYNNEELGDPLINDHHAVALGMVTYGELGYIYDIARKTNEVLGKLFAEIGIELVDVKLEFGRDAETGDIIISDEISPDNARLWDVKTGESLDKDRFRRDLSDVVASYREVYNRLAGIQDRK